VGDSAHPGETKVQLLGRPAVDRLSLAMSTPLPGRRESATPPAWDVTRVLLAVVAIGGLMAATFWVLRPFLPALIWAAMIVIATWPVMRTVQARLWGRRGLAVAVMTAAMVVIVVAPIAVSVLVVAEHAEDAVGWSKSLVASAIAGPPAWLSDVPLVGTRLAAEWQALAAERPEDLVARVSPYLTGIGRWTVRQAGGLGLLLVQLALIVVLSALLYSRGDAVAAGVRAFARRLAGASGDEVVVLSAQAIRAVALGIVVTALVQSGIGGIGLAITGVPYAALLSAVMFLLAVAQVGTGPVLFGAVIWLYWKDATLWAIVLLVWSLVTVSLDNVLRPMLIKRGADLPLILIFAGVLGGLFAFGIIGLFVGPVVLAVTYTLLVAWVAQGDRPPEGDRPPAS
jgi:predicted PurR-regulated permease PerM